MGDPTLSCESRALGWQFDIEGAKLRKIGIHRVNPTIPHNFIIVVPR